MILPAAVLFDMDGTLTEPMLDFPRIKAEMGIGDRPILEALAGMNPRERSIAETVLHRHEEEAARGSTLNPGCRELLEWLDARGRQGADHPEQPPERGNGDRAAPGCGSTS